MIKKIFQTVNILSIAASLILYSLLIRVLLLYGNKYALLFSDPKEMGMNIHYTLAIPYCLVLNAYVFLPICSILLLYLIIKKELQKNTILLCALNIFCFYFISINNIGPIVWLCD